MYNYYLRWTVGQLSDINEVTIFIIISVLYIEIFIESHQWYIYTYGYQAAN